jgi:hypothetical protein
MNPKKLWKLTAALIMLTLVTLACGTGYRTTSNISGNSGTIRVQRNEADGTDRTNVEINEDYIRETVFVSANLSVESGTCGTRLVGEDGTSLSLTASAGNPGTTSGELVTDGFGEITLETESQQASKINLEIKFERR